MQTKFRPSITSYSSLLDTKMVVDELIEDLQSQLDAETYEQIVQILNAKKVELDERYNRNR